MKFSINRETLLVPLQQVAGVVERRQTLPVLSNVLFVLKNNTLSVTGTDLEVELVSKVPLLGDGYSEGKITLPAKKLFDICKSLDQESEIHFQLNEQRMVVKSGRSRFSLATLPASDFPSLDETLEGASFEMPQAQLRQLIERTSFAMAQQDVRFYLNGMLLEIKQGLLKAVATDGHRLALCDANQRFDDVGDVSVVVPRKGISELARLFVDPEANLQVSLGQHHIRVETDRLIFTSKVIDGKFPDYERVLPKGGTKVVVADRDVLKQAFLRASILSNEKYRGVRVTFSKGLVNIVANNPEQEEAEEQVNVDYTGEDLDIGFNVSYVLDVLNVIKTNTVRFTLSDSNSSALVEEPEDDKAAYVVMPMRL